jgi:hypothetical protein
MTNDPFADHQIGIDSPGDDIVPIVPNDAADLPTAVRALRAESSGTIRITTRSGNIRDIKFKAGELRPILTVRVWATGTTVPLGDIEGHV